MKSLTFILISLLSGVIAGVILAGVNYFVVEPYIDRAIEIEVDNSVASGEVVDFDELSSYRVWQKEGTFAAGAILGTNLWGNFRNCLCIIEKVLTIIR